jgi:hypothetical protein
VTGSLPELTAAAAEASGLAELTDQLVKRAQEAGAPRRDLRWKDTPMIVCGVGPTTQPMTGPWPRLVEIIIDPRLRAMSGTEAQRGFELEAEPAASLAPWPRTTSPPRALVDDPVRDLFVGDGSDGIDQRLQNGGSARKAA